MQFISQIKEGVEFIQLVEDNNVLFSVSPDHGARLTDLYFKVNNALHSVLWEVSPNDCKTGEWSKSEILFPFPNRIEDGKYEFEGISYQLPVNEKRYNNAIHGMVTNVKFEAIDQRIEDNTASLKLRYKYNGGKSYYPFPFVLDMTYEYGSDGFNVIFDVKNSGAGNLPFGLGWHPYFKLGDRGLSGLRYAIPESDHLLLGNRSLPTGEVQNFSQANLNLEDWNLDDCFRLKQSEVSYILASDQISLKMTGSDAFRYLQLFTPEGLGTIAIEPMTSGVNVFNNHEGIRFLKSMETFQVSFKISVYHSNE
ncbi:MAG: aldose 1-epimerase [Cyclobacteriaceae bacterium]|jgi:aldose 1-epimerase